MRLFVAEMRRVPIDPKIVLLAIAAASNFDANLSIGNNVGLLMLRRDDLREVGYPEVVPFETLTAPEQIPWIGRVISYRTANTGDVVMSVPDLAVLLAHSQGVDRVIRAEAERRAERARGTMLYIHHDQLLDSVLTGRERR